ncbi:SDR family oxidoreductase [Candidatus Pelagibacter sp.]|jgi:NAD(P)-dependent dehydrogenase (short-subunit alcohol dehydrogenase family)|nr:SDR family oxidoreductase [Candidatus Pelagibacter sp.]|tara:strand:- start:10109 stop:10897 length:789 start_codon:yes stop_codon:yes gene_type:complete
MEEKKLVIITGGCGLLGWEFAKALNEINFKIILLDNSKANIKEKKKLNQVVNLDCDFFNCDITNKKKMDLIIKKIHEKYKKIDVLINNACLDYVPKKIKKNFVNNSFINYSIKRLNKEINVGLTGALICSQLVGSIMLKYKSGIIINIGSDLSIIAPNQSLYKHMNIIKPVGYSLVKSGLHGLTRYLASLWGEKGLRINTLSPGGIENNQDKKFVNKLKQIIPMKRMAKKNEYNEVIKFLCTDSSAYMNGHNLIIDGGRTII